MKKQTLDKYLILSLLFILLPLMVVISGASASEQVGTGNADKGELVYARCKACHSLRRNRTGPKHCGLFGRKAGSVKDFDYSDAMSRSNIVWNLKTLDAFLASPFKMIPGTSMGYGGVWNLKERSDLIAYLQQASRSSGCN